MLLSTLTSLGVAASMLAGGPTLTADHACYRADELMTLTTAGFADGEPVSFRGNGARLRLSWNDDQAGGLRGDGTVRVQAPSIEESPGVDGIPLHLEATSYRWIDAVGDYETVAAGLDVRLVDMFWAWRSPEHTVRRKVTYSVRGAVELTPVYLHLTRQTLPKPGKRPKILPTRTITLGTPRGPCGTLETTMYPLGTKRPKPGLYSIQVDLSPDHNDSEEAWRTRVNLPELAVSRRR